MALPEQDLVVNLLGGLIRICVFLGYILAVSQLKEIRRVFQYHGAEHKAVYCYENNLPLTVEKRAEIPHAASALRHELSGDRVPDFHPHLHVLGHKQFERACPCGQPPGAFARGGGRVL